MSVLKCARFTVLTALLSVPAFAQVDLAGEWAPRFHEDQLRAHSGVPTSATISACPSTRAALAPRRQLGRFAADVARAPVQAASLRLRHAWPRQHPNLERSGYGHPGNHRVAHPHFMAGSGAHHLDGRPPSSARLRRSHLARFLDREDGRQYADYHHHSPQERLDPPQRDSRSADATVTEQTSHAQRQTTLPGW